jgi:hypothetical protein
MSHLSRDERLLALDGALDPTRQGHLASCLSCRTDVETLGRVLAQVRAVDVPEPSPLFWDHLAARVGDAIAREPGPRSARAWWSPRLAWAAVAVVIAAAGAGYLARSRPQPHVPTVVAQGTAVPGDPDAGDLAAATNGANASAAVADDGWALIAAVADQVAGDDAFAPQVGQAELSISALSADERRALAGELAAELATGGKREG